MVRLAVLGFEKANGKHEAHHAEGAEEEGAAATPFVEEYDGGEGEEHVEDVLDGSCEERVADISGFHNVHDVVHPSDKVSHYERQN